MKYVIIDNYDSFTYNLVQLFKEAGASVDVIRNDLPDLDILESYDKIILSPGPGLPEEAGKTLEIIDKFKGIKPILGVCLGEQAIARYFGAKLYNLPEVMHGIQSEITPNCKISHNRLFDSLPSPIMVGRYHSWAVGNEDFPESLEITATTKDGTIMGIRHKRFDIEGIQFHPESILTPDGKQMIKQWLTSNTL